VRVRRQVQRHTVEENGDIRAVVEIEAAQKILVGLAAAGVLRDDETGKRLQNLSRAKNGTIFEFLRAHRYLAGGLAIPTRSSCRPCTVMVVLTAHSQRDAQRGRRSVVPMVTGISLVSKPGFITTSR
jgi:hypothetical protein